MRKRRPRTSRNPKSTRVRNLHAEAWARLKNAITELTTGPVIAKAALEFDRTQLGMWITRVGARAGTSLSRPYLSTTTDVYSGIVVGFSIGFESK